MAKNATIIILVMVLLFNPVVSIAGQCGPPTKLKLGDVAPCDGELISEIQLAQYVKWYENGPKYKKLYLESREDSNFLLTPTAPPPVQWHQSPIFWGTTIGVICLGVGLVLGFWIKSEMDSGNNKFYLSDSTIK